jgi:hypothetical protein
LQETAALGAEGNAHLVWRNSGDLKKARMGSLAGPESPRPCSHRTKLRLRPAMREEWTSLAGREDGGTRRRRVTATTEAAAMAVPRVKRRRSRLLMGRTGLKCVE